MIESEEILSKKMDNNVQINMENIISEIVKDADVNGSFSTNGDSDILENTLRMVLKSHHRQCVEAAVNCNDIENTTAAFSNMMARKLPEIAREVGYMYTLPEVLWRKLVRYMHNVFEAELLDIYTQRIHSANLSIGPQMRAMGERAYEIVLAIKHENRRRLNIDDI